MAERPTVVRLLILVSMVLVGCTRVNPAYDPNPGLPDECRSGTEVTETFTTFARPDKLDVLFVIDASGDDPAAIQELFANAAAPVGAVLRALDIDARTAVATTDGSSAGLAGPGRTGATCAANDVLVASLSDSGWADALRCNLFAAPSSGSYSQPLAVVQDLLENPPSDFLREDARLLVVIGTRSDDCSAAGPLSGPPREACAQADLRPVNELIAAWGEQRPLSDVGLVVFSGPPSSVSADVLRPVCSSAIGSAMAGNRLFEATQLCGYGDFHSVCTDDVFRPLAAAVEAFVTEVPLTLCPGELTHEPLAVEADGDPIRLGEDGFTYLAATADCPGGALQFAASAVTGVDEVEITYCTPE